jgi:peroxiredoxin
MTVTANLRALKESGLPGRLLFVALFCAVTAGSAVPLHAGMAGMKIPVDAPAPDFTLKGLDGKEYTLSSYKGKKVVMIDFWATWCNICKREMPVLESTYQEYKDKGVEFLGITLDENVKQITKVVESKGVTYPILIDEGARVATESYQLAGPIPLKVVIDKEGIVVYSHVGDFPEYPPEIVFVFDELLAE